MFSPGEQIESESIDDLLQLEAGCALQAIDFIGMKQALSQKCSATLCVISVDFADVIADYARTGNESPCTAARF
jgi:hypothetical protein